MNSEKLRGRDTSTSTQGERSAKGLAFENLECHGCGRSDNLLTFVFCFKCGKPAGHHGCVNFHGRPTCASCRTGALNEDSFWTKGNEFLPGSPNTHVEAAAEQSPALDHSGVNLGLADPPMLVIPVQQSRRQVKAESEGFKAEPGLKPAIAERIQTVQQLPDLPHHPLMEPNVTQTRNVAAKLPLAQTVSEAIPPLIFTPHGVAGSGPQHVKLQLVNPYYGYLPDQNTDPALGFRHEPGPSDTDSDNSYGSVPPQLVHDEADQYTLNNKKRRRGGNAIRAPEFEPAAKRRRPSRVKINAVRSRRYNPESKVGVALTCALVRDDGRTTRSVTSLDIEKQVQLSKQSGQGYHCPHPGCGKVVRLKCHFTRHLKLHSRSIEERRPHKCPRCPRRFAQRCNLKAHMTTHNKDRHQPFSCRICGLSFTRKHGVKRHIERRHKSRPFSDAMIVYTPNPNIPMIKVEKLDPQILANLASSGRQHNSTPPIKQEPRDPEHMFPPMLPSLPPIVATAPSPAVPFQLMPTNKHPME